MDLGSIIAIVTLGFVAGAVARVLTPNDAFRKMSGPKSWAVSFVLGVAGALLGYWFFTTLLGIGDTDRFDWGGIVGAIIGAMVVTVVASFVLRRARTYANGREASGQARERQEPVPQFVGNRL